MLRSKRLGRRVLTGFVLILLFAAAGCAEKEAAPTAQGEIRIPVSAAVAKRDNISSEITLTGKVTPVSEVMVIPKIPGKVLQVPVDVGSAVQKGDLLVRLDTKDLELSLEAAQTALKNAQLAHNQAVFTYDNAKINYDRMKALYAAGAAAKIEMEQAELQYNLAKESVDQPAVDAAQNQIDTIRNQMANAMITSPVTGEISNRSVDPGEMAGTGQPVMTVVNIDQVLIEADVAEKELGFVAEGQEISLDVGAVGKTFTGVISTVSPAANPQTKAYQIKVEVANEQHILKPGMFASLKVETARKENVVVIPAQALLTKNAQPYVFVVRDGKAEERPVQTGLKSGDRVEIVRGLSEGEAFVTDGQNGLTDEAEVDVVNSDKN